MTGSALVTFIATVLAAQSGVVDIDLGSKAGLRAGDSGVVFYESTVGDQVESIEIGPATVTQVSSYTASLEVAEDLEARSGFLVRFDLPRSRIGRSLERESPQSLEAPPASRVVPMGSAVFVTDTPGACLNLRALPAATSTALACIPHRTTVTVFKSVRDWKKARLADGREGWMAAVFLTGGDLAGYPAGPVGEDIPPSVHEESASLAAAGATYRVPADSDDLSTELDAANESVRRLLGQISLNQSTLSQEERTRSELSRRLVADLASRLVATRTSVESTEAARSKLSERITWLTEERQTLEQQLEAASRSAQTTAAESAKIDAQSASIAAELAEKTEGLLEARRRLEQQIEEQRSIELQLEETLDQLRAVEAARAESDARLATATADFERISAQRDELQAALHATRSDFVSVEAERDQLAQQLEVTRSELVQTETVAGAAKEALRQEIRNAEVALAALQDQLATKAGALASTEARLAAVESEYTTISAEVGTTRTDRKSDLKREFKLANQALREVTREKQALEIWLDERGDELARAQAKVAIMQSEIDRLEATPPANRREIDRTRAALIEAQRQAAELQQRLTARERQAENMEVELAAARRELTAANRAIPSSENRQIEQEKNPPAENGAAIVVLVSAAPCLNFRAEPKLGGEVFDCLNVGTRMGLLGHWEAWNYVELADGRAGWVASLHVGPADSGVSRR